MLPEIECAPPALRDEIILAKLKSQLDYAWERCPFYRRKWKEAGVSPATLKSLADLTRAAALRRGGHARLHAPRADLAAHDSGPLP